MSVTRKICLIGIVILLCLYAALTPGCRKAVNSVGTGDADSDSDSDGDADFDSDGDADPDSDDDADSDGNSDFESDESDNREPCSDASWEGVIDCLHGDLYKCKNGYWEFVRECGEGTFCLSENPPYDNGGCESWAEFNDADSDTDTDTDSDGDNDGDADGDSDGDADSDVEDNSPCDNVSFEIMEGGYICAGAIHGYAWTSPGAIEGAEISPKTFELVTDDETELCVMGQTAADENWGSVGLLGINARQAEGASQTGLWRPTKENEGIDVTVRMNVNFNLRLQIRTETGGEYCTPILDGDNSVKWEDLTIECWDGNNPSYNGEDAIETVMLLVPGHNEDDIPYDFCLEQIIAIGSAQ